ncbi:hypothetical protein F5Y15DRAFT_372444 [Xylariaceae sp. FL0016]|nr:hypothetical protein F5Y15DRAFT_372444 [Xylariaceae sp. FL0016]
MWMAEEHVYVEEGGRSHLRPFANHMNLLRHANEILERLDHEYSAMGGLLSIIPLDSENLPEKEALDQAKSTLLGQLILQLQHLTLRMHELEISYGNSVDLLANEAIVPAQQLSIHGADGRQGREIVFPQDRWILANANEDVFNFIHRWMDQEEAMLDKRDDRHQENGILGPAAMGGERGDRYKGIVQVTLKSIFYRLRNSGHGPIFILPAGEDRPDVEETRKIEKRPTVVTLPAPKGPTRVTEWEKNHHGLERRNQQLSQRIAGLQGDNSNLKVMNQLHKGEIKRLQDMQATYQTQLGKDPMEKDDELSRLRADYDIKVQQLTECGDHNANLEDELKAYRLANQLAEDDTKGKMNLLNGVTKELVDLRRNHGKLEDQLRASRQQCHRLEGEVAMNKMYPMVNAQRTMNPPMPPMPPMHNASQDDQSTNNQPMNQPMTQPMTTNSNVEMPEAADTGHGNHADQIKALQDENQRLRDLRNQQCPKIGFEDVTYFQHGSCFRDTEKGLLVCSIAYFDALEAERERFRKQVQDAANARPNTRGNARKNNAQTNKSGTANTGTTDNGTKNAGEAKTGADSKNQNKTGNFPWSGFNPFGAKSNANDANTGNANPNAGSNKKDDTGDNAT